MKKMNSKSEFRCVVDVCVCVCMWMQTHVWEAACGHLTWTTSRSRSDAEFFSTGAVTEALLRVTTENSADLHLGSWQSILKSAGLISSVSAWSREFFQTCIRFLFSLKVGKKSFRGSKWSLFFGLQLVILKIFYFDSSVNVCLLHVSRIHTFTSVALQRSLCSLCVCLQHESIDSATLQIYISAIKQWV